MGENQPTSGPPVSGAWTVWPVFGESEAAGARAGQEGQQRSVFRLVTGIAACGLAAIAVRAIGLERGFPWADALNSLFFFVVLGLSWWRPGWLRPLAWAGLVAFFFNTLDGLQSNLALPITPTHVLLPLLVLYGALLGDLGLSLAALAGVLGVYAWSAARYWPLTNTDLLGLTNLGLVALCSGLAALGVWLQQRRLAEALRRQADSLRRELEARLRLNAVIFHDLKNPLGALVGAVELARRRAAPGPADLALIEEAVAQLARVVQSARECDAPLEVPLAEVAVAELARRLRAQAAPLLAAKAQTLEISGGAGLAARANPDLLCHSVLGNLLGNAAKFSPRGARLELAAVATGNEVRLEVRDAGPGFAPEVLELGARGRPCRPRPGSEGELGSAYGLRIAALFLHRLGGRLEVRNLPGGGAAAAAVLPRAATPPG